PTSTNTCTSLACSCCCRRPFRRPSFLLSGSIMSTSQSSSSNKKKGTARTGRSRLRIADAKVSTILMLVLAIFMVLIVAVGGIGAWFLQQNLKQSEQADRQNDVSRIVYGLGQNMMSARISLLVAARY